MNMKIQSCMTKELISINPHENLNEAARLLWEGDIGTMPVLDENRRLIGMITDRDMLMACYTQGRRLQDIQVRDAMSNQIISCKQDDDVSVAEQAMQKHCVRRLPVIDDNEQLVGIISINDIALAYKREKGQQVKASDVADTLAAVCQHRQHERVSHAA